MRFILEFFKTENKFISIIKGVIISILFTLVLLTIFAVLLVYTNLQEETIKPVIITVTGISILVGSSISTKKIKKNGLINGAIIGGTYIFMLYIISSILNSNFSINITSIIMIVIGILGGIVRRNNRNK